MVSITAAPGGVGKSSLVVAEALSMQSGKDLHHGGLVWMPDGLNVAIISPEDPVEEILKKYLAAAKHYQIEQPNNSLFVYELDGPLVAKSGHTEPTVAVDRVGSLLEFLLTNSIDVLIVDPLVKMHQVNENDNGEMNVVMQIFNQLAQRAECSVMLVHHTSKEGNDSRGASNIVNSARLARKVWRGADPKCPGWKSVSSGGADKDDYVFVQSTKSNYSSLTDGYFIKREFVNIGNGNKDYPAGDTVQILVQAELKTKRAAEVSELLTILDRLSELEPHQRRWRLHRNHAADDKAECLWACEVVNCIRDLDKYDEEGQKVVEGLVENGMLEVSKDHSYLEGKGAKPKWSYVQLTEAGRAKLVELKSEAEEEGEKTDD